MRHRLFNLLLFALALLSTMPFLWLIHASFTESVVSPNTTHSTTQWTLFNFRFLFNKYPFIWWSINSVFVSCAQTVLVVVLCTLGGYGLAKYTFRFKKLIMAVMFCSMLVPHQILMPSMQLILYRIGWMDSYAAIIIPGAISVFGIFLFHQSMKQVPDDLLNAARIDGCNEFGLYWNIALPMVRPMTGAFTLLSFMGNWNSFLWPQIVLHSHDKYTLPIGLTNMMGQSELATPSGVVLAGTLLSVIPVVILFFVLQKDFVAGIASGAIKG